MISDEKSEEDVLDILVGEDPLDHMGDEHWSGAPRRSVECALMADSHPGDIALADQMQAAAADAAKNFITTDDTEAVEQAIAFLRAQLERIATDAGLEPLNHILDITGQIADGKVDVTATLSGALREHASRAGLFWPGTP